MGYTFGSSDAADFEIPDENVYVFQLTEIGEPRVEPNPFYKEGEPESKRERCNIRLDCTVYQTVGGDDELRGVMVRHYSGSAPGNEMGSDQYPTKLRGVAEAILGRKLEPKESVDSDQLINGYFTATLKHKTKKDGGIKAVIESPMPYRQQGTGQGGRRRQAPPPPPPPVDEEFDTAEFDDAEVAS